MNNSYSNSVEVVYEQFLGDNPNTNPTFVEEPFSSGSTCDNNIDIENVDPAAHTN